MQDGNRRSSKYFAYQICTSRLHFLQRKAIQNLEYFGEFEFLESKKETNHPPSFLEIQSKSVLE
jgi:hypothetical protein